jgi:hypothetical protein
MSKRAELRVVWSKRESNFLIHHDRHTADGHFMYSFLRAGVTDVIGDPFDVTMAAFRAELEKRGFDPNTFQISVRRKREVSR